MRTKKRLTIELDDERDELLKRQARAKAIREGQTLKTIILDFLKRYIKKG